MKNICILCVVAVFCLGCVTSKTTARQIDRQIKYLDALEQARWSAEDRLKELGEKIEQGKQDLEALKILRLQEEGSVEPILVVPDAASADNGG